MRGGLQIFIVLIPVAGDCKVFSTAEFVSLSINRMKIQN